MPGTVLGHLGYLHSRLGLSVLAGNTTNVGQGVCISQEITQSTGFQKISNTYLPAKTDQATTFISFLLIIFLVTDFLLRHNYLILWPSHKRIDTGVNGKENSCVHWSYNQVG